VTAKCCKQKLLGYLFLQSTNVLIMIISINEAKFNMNCMKAMLMHICVAYILPTCALLWTFLADGTNGRAYATVLRLSSSLSITLCIVAKRCVLWPKVTIDSLLSHTRNWLVPKWMTFQWPWSIKWSRDQWRHVTPKGQTRDPNLLRAQYLENRWRATIAN